MTNVSTRQPASATTSAILAHECMNRMTAEARERITFSAAEEKRKTERRAQAANEGGV